MVEVYKEDFVYDGDIIDEHIGETKHGNPMIIATCKVHSPLAKYAIKKYLFPGNIWELLLAIDPNFSLVGKKFKCTVIKNERGYWEIDKFYSSDDWCPEITRSPITQTTEETVLPPAVPIETLLDEDIPF